MEENMNTGESMEAAAPVEVNESGPTEGQQIHQQEERNVPLDALQAERAERQRLQDELKMMKDNMQLFMAQQQQQPKQKQDEFNGLADDDVLTVGEFKKALSAKEQQYNMSLQELRMTQQHPDYQEVVTKYLPEVINQNPSLAKSLQETQDYELAYYLAKNSEGYKSQHKQAKRNADAERIVKNANMAGSLSSAGQTSPISEAKRYKSMSDSEFRSLMNKNLGYF